MLLLALAADRAPTIRKPWSAPANSTTEIPGASPIAVRISSGVPKLSLVPCRTSLGTVGANSSATRDFSGRPGRCSGNAKHTIAAGCVRRRPAGHSSAGAPPAYQELMLGPLLADQPVQRSAPRLVQFGRRRADLAPCCTPRLFEPHHARADCRQVLSQQFKINRGDAAAGAMTEHEDGIGCSAGSRNNLPGPCGVSTGMTVEVMIRSASPDQAPARAPQRAAR